MKVIHTCFLTAVLIASCLTGSAQFVKLENGGLWLEGEPFYPEVVNATLNWVYPNGSNSNPVIKVSSAGSELCTSNPYCNVCFTDANCNQFIQEEFQQIASFGFNTIRLVGCPKYTFDGGQTSNNNDPFDTMPDNYDGFYIRGTNAVDNTYQLIYTLLEYPYDPNIDEDVNRLFNQYEAVLDMAHQAGLKVILLTGGKEVLPPQGPAATDPYPVYLGQLASRLKNHPALLAYDLYNEPGLQEQPLHTVGSKQIVCQSTTFWYDAIKANDPNHLVTIGAGTSDDVLSWDPLIMKVDFISPHYYPNVSARDGYSVSEANKRFQIGLHWHYKNTTKPFLIGETGFSAEDERNSGNPALDNVPNEKIHGTEQQAKEFAHMSRKYAWDSNAIGYSWWDWRDSRPTDWNEPDNYYALIRKNKHPSDPLGQKKPLEEYAENTPQNHPRGVSQEPANYYNPWNLTNPNNRITRTVLDQYGNPITNAVIEAHSANSGTTAPAEGWKPCDTFTDENGVFTVIPDDDLDPTNPDLISKIVKISVSAPGAELKSSGWDYENWSTYTYFPEDIPIQLQRLDFSTDRIVQGETVVANTSETFSGNATLTASNVVVEGNGTADFTARNEVNAINEFHANVDSETHLFCEEAAFDCSNLASIPFNPRLPNPNTTEEENEKPAQIEIFFKNSESVVDVYPNPSSGIFTIAFNSGVVQNSILVYDFTGRLVKTINSMKTIIDLDLSNEARGVYLLSVTLGASNKSVFNHKIILQ